MRLLQHTKYHKPAHANYAYDYIKWSERNGRHVGKIERHFITALEYKRVVLQKGRTLRVLIMGDYYNEFLIRYLAYLTTHVYSPGYTLPNAIITPNAADAREKAKRCTDETHSASGRRVDNLRGINLFAYLVLHADNLGPNYGITPRYLTRTSRVIMGTTINDCANRAIIVQSDRYDFVTAQLQVLHTTREARLCLLPPLPVNTLYIYTEVAAPRAPDTHPPAPTPSTPTTPSHPPSTMRAATSAA